MEFSTDGALILATTNRRGDNRSEASAWETNTGTLAGPPIPYVSVNSSSSAAFRHDGKVVAALDKDQKARLYDTRTGKELCNPIHSDGGIWSIAFSPDDRSVLTGENRGIIRLRAPQTGLPTGPPLQNPLTGKPCFAAFSRDGQSILSLEGEFAWIWKVANKSLVATVELEDIATNQLEQFETGGLCPYRDMLKPNIFDMLQRPVRYRLALSSYGWLGHRYEPESRISLV